MWCFERLHDVRTIFPVGPPAPSDAELISATRAGDADAYAQLAARHADSARRLARMLVPTDHVEALVTDTFAKIELVLQRGDGPSLALRPYLLTAVRRLAPDHGQTGAQPVAAPQDPAAARAFTSLAEPWRLVLWHTEVEGEEPADIAVLLGEPADHVPPLIARAREGMRSAWLTMHEPAADQDCAWTRRALGAYARQVSFQDDTARVELHLEGCDECSAILRELTDSGSNLRAILAPLVLGAAAATYLDSTKDGTAASGKPSRLAAGRAAAVGAIAAGFGRIGASSATAAGRVGEQFAKVKVLTAKRTAAVAIAGVAAVAVIAGGTFIVVQTADGPVEASAEAPGDIALEEDSSVGEPQATDDPVDPEASDIGAAASASSSASASDDPSSSASSLPTDSTTDGPSDAPSQDPTRPGQPTQQPSPDPTRPGQPTQQPTRQPTRQPTQQPTQPPSQTPTSTPTQAPPPTDLSIAASSNNLAGTFYAIDVRITGLGSGATATLTVQSSGGNSSGLTMDGSRCTQTAGGGATCRVTSNPESFRFRANALSGRSSTLTFTVTPDNGSDANPSDNSTSVTIRP